MAETEQIIRKAFRETNDRLDNGDSVLHRGKLVRVPMKGKDAFIVGAVAFDKRSLILNRPTSISKSGGADGLKELADKFRRIRQENSAKVVAVQEKDGEKEEEQ